METQDVYLVNMPIDFFYSPSIGLGLLKAEANKRGLKTKVLYANLIFASYLGLERYKKLHKYALALMLFIESLFQPYAGYENITELEDIIEFYKHRNASIDKELDEYADLVREIWEIMDEYLDDIADRILAANPKAVGCTYTMQQFNASLAILKRIKEKSPDVVTFMGGSACSIHAGQAIVDYIDFVDYAFTGESDDIFADALRLMIDRNDEALAIEHPWVIRKGGTAKSHATSDLNLMAYPDYDDYFDTLKELGFFGKIDVMLLAEGSRGCWWGCKRKCNFCGLSNSSETIAYREKDTKRLVDELYYLRNRYNINKFFLTDCIQSRKQMKELPNYLEGAGFNLFTEVKTNMTYEELLGIRKAGFVWVQPGIEALQDDILKHINKGNRAIKHIEFMRNCKQLGIMLYWNLLRGFPGEESEWYYETIDTIPYVYHLCSPSSGIFQYQKLSYFTIVHEEYGVKLERERYYSYLFGKNEEFLDRFAEFFYDPDRQMPYEEKIVEAITQWTQATYNRADLVWFNHDGFLAIVDTRPFATEKIKLYFGVEKRICELSDKVVKLNKLYEKLNEEGYTEDEINVAIHNLVSRKVIIKINDEVLFLALPKGYERNNPGVELYPNF